MPDFTDRAFVVKWGRLGTLGTDEQAVIDALVSGVTATFQNFCSRDFFKTTYDERYDGTGQPKLTLRNSPIISVASLTVDEVPVAPAASSIVQGFLFQDDTLYFTNGTTTPTVVLPPGSVFQFPGVFTRGRQNVHVVYDAGFDSAASPLPRELADLKIMATQQVLYEYNRLRGTIGERSKTLGNAQSVTLVTDDIHPAVKGKLLRYVRRTPIA